ncbi:putative SP-containing membrane protein [Vairimorpha necatrix]|uniref:SP-containing membrane protein n=1 Tax=Vairimorpha necatrix TaxID=6039 RepID=A0AAX4JFT4_9MICR
MIFFYLLNLSIIKGLTISELDESDNTVSNSAVDYPEPNFGPKNFRKSKNPDQKYFHYDAPSIIESYFINSILNGYDEEFVEKFIQELDNNQISSIYKHLEKIKTYHLHKITPQKYISTIKKEIDDVQIRLRHTIDNRKDYKTTICYICGAIIVLILIYLIFLKR